MQTFNLNVTQDDLNVILNALSDGPHKIVNQIINKLIKQAQDQLEQDQPETVDK